jgi:predicted PilT family ATPase
MSGPSSPPASQIVSGPSTSSTPEGVSSHDDAKLQIRILIDERSVGGLIGKGGAVVNKIRQDTGCLVDISDAVSGAKKRCVTVVGLHASLAKCLHLIAERLHDQKKKGGTDSSAYDTKSIVPTDSECNLTLLIPNSQVGGIIGKSGIKINATRSETGCNIKISEKPLDNSTEKSVVLRGSSKSIYAALQKICLQLTEVSDKTARIPYVPRPEYNPFAFSPYPAPLSPDYRDLGYHPRDYRDIGYHPRYGQPSKVPPQTIVVPVPDYLMGTVIGKGGASINEIRARSGAHIKISELESGASDRMITITGSPQSNDMAIALIHQKMAEWSSPSSSSSNSSSSSSSA